MSARPSQSSSAIRKLEPSKYTVSSTKHPSIMRGALSLQPIPTRAANKAEKTGIHSSISSFFQSVVAENFIAFIEFMDFGTIGRACNERENGFF